MTGACLACLRDAPGGSEAHPACLRSLFGSAHVPAIDIDLARFQTFALATVGRTALSGVQRKLSVELEGRRLQVATRRATYILKPPAPEWESLPENEHLVMNLGRLSGLEVPPLGLVRLADGRPAYLVRRFDRTADGKLACEDFCQLMELPPKDKYASTAERCASVIRRFATDPGIEMLSFFRSVLFSWWVGDGDLHLKNMSLVRDADGTWRLSPAYDRVSTALLIPGDELALPVQGKRSNLKRATWLAFAEACGLPERAATMALAGQASVLAEAVPMVRRSALPGAMQERLIALLAANTERLR